MSKRAVLAVTAALFLSHSALAQPAGVTALSEDDITCNDWLRNADGSWATVGSVKIRGVTTQDRKTQDASEMSMLDRKCGAKATENK